MLKKILLALVVIVAAFLGYVALQPSTMRVQRTGTIDAPPDVAFAQVNDFRAWEAWSPWAKLDPNSKATFEGPTAGAGSVFHWSGNDQVGEGTMTITESKPYETIRIKLDFRKPFAGTNDVEFAFKPEGNQTAVSWTMTGEKNFFCKLMGVFMDMDQMIGGDFEKGLASMNQAAKATAKR